VSDFEDDRLICYPGRDTYPLNGEVNVIGIEAFAAKIAKR
jgi:hypothetical protein